MGAQSTVKLFGYYGTISRNEKEETMLKTYKFRIYPNNTTANKLQWVMDRCRELYNAALQERKEAYKYAGKSISCFDQINDLQEIKHVLRLEYEDIAAHVLNDVLQRLDKIYKRYIHRAKLKKQGKLIGKVGS